MVANFWKLARWLGMAVWIGRVRSKLNVADLPTRIPPLPFDVERISEFNRLLAHKAECPQWID